MKRMHRSWRARARRVALLGAVLVLASAPARAAENDMAEEGGLGAAAALVTLLYGPAKLLYAGGGLLVGGCAWLFSAGDYDVVGPILTASVRGDYVVTPAHLRGQRPLEFIGRPPQDRRQAGYAAGGAGF